MRTLVTVFTGFLGAGKTSIVLQLVQKLPKDYKVVLLKNEFGDLKVDSELAKQSSISVLEMLNGCLCCVLVGQMKQALLDIKEKFAPDRIIIEASGSAFPAPIAWQIRQMKDEGFDLDAIITVVDCLNFRGYQDTSYTAKMQAKYTDIILLNKYELISESEFERVLDHVYELNTDTPKIKYPAKEGIDYKLMLGLDTKLFILENEVDKVRLEMEGHSDHHDSEVDLIQVNKKDDPGISKPDLEAFLVSLPAENFYRIKGFVKFENRYEIANFAFGRSHWTLIRTDSEFNSDRAIQLTFMGVELDRYMKQIQDFLKLGDSEVNFHDAHDHTH